MTLRAAALAAAIVVLLAGCALVDRSPSPEPDFYRLSYEAGSTKCAASFPTKLRVRRFSADHPFGQQRMVFWGRNRTVRFSRSARWVAEPGAMLAEGIRRDLSRSGLFSGVVQGISPDGPHLELSGRILRFAAEPCDAGYRALFGVEVRLQERSGEKAPLLQQRYSLESGCFPAKDAARFARAMSDLASEFSDRLREDLCLKQMKGL
jgi:ABC-type uncharacterized transport system auxiliary subunit